MAGRSEKAEPRVREAAPDSKDAAKGKKLPEPPAGYVYVTRAEPTVEVDGETKPAGYVHIPGEEEPRLVDEKSLPELAVLGYRPVG